MIVERWVLGCCVEETESVVRPGSRLYCCAITYCGQTQRIAKYFAEAVAQGRSGGGAIRNVVLAGVSRMGTGMPGVRVGNDVVVVKRVDWLVV